MVCPVVLQLLHFKTPSRTRSNDLFIRKHYGTNYAAKSKVARLQRAGNNLPSTVALFHNGVKTLKWKDSGQSWDTPSPDFSLCFEKTVLVWGPCLLLWILSPIEIYLMMNSKCRDIPWGFTNTAKLLLNVMLVVISTVSLVWSVVMSLQGVQVFPVDIWTSAVQTLTFQGTLCFLPRRQEFSGRVKLWLGAASCPYLMKMVNGLSLSHATLEEETGRFLPTSSVKQDGNSSLMTRLATVLNIKRATPIPTILAAVILVWDKLRGLHTSGVLFLFWLLLTLGGALQFRTELTQLTSGRSSGVSNVSVTRTSYGGACSSMD
ncbi:Canalicular multispecific organic anion transporter 1 [Homalodisca vitripennis]|nr:Canalicular multispecific organic anion transporter 1 [Homalodisca vitripennis]